MMQSQRELWCAVIVTTSGALMAPSALALDCSKARTSTEKAICADPELKKLDAQLNRDYAAFRAHYQKSGKYDCLLEDETKKQKEWLRKRDACGADKQCIRSAYENRLQNLNKYTGLCYPEDSSFVHAGRSCYDPPSPTAPVASTASPTAPTASTQSSKCERISSASEVPNKEDKKSKAERLKTEQEEISEYNKDHFVASDKGVLALALFEGISLCMYDDSSGFATTGIGHLIAYTSISNLPTKEPEKFEQYRGDIASEAEAYDLKREDMNYITQFAATRIKVKLNACQTDALMAFFFNVGKNIPSIYKLANACDFECIANKMQEYNKAKNKTTGKKEINQGLVNRRKMEADMLLHCKYPKGNPRRLSCCTYELQNKYQRVAPGSYRAKCKKDCTEGGACYGI